MTKKDTLERAYGNVPREIPDPFSWTDELLPRSIKYFWLKWIVRKFLRQELKMAKPQQTSSELGRTLAGQLSKSEKRAIASRSIMDSNQRTKAINKAIKQQQFIKHLFLINSHTGI